jgi:biopolymer transport protein ExbB/TolQ
MSQPNRKSISWISVLPSLVIPVCLGLTLYIGMLAMIRHGVLENETALRYLTGHPISKLSVAMFLIGASSLLMIALNVFTQFASERHLRFEPLSQKDLSTDAEANDADVAVALGQQLLGLPRSVHSHYLWQRLTNSLLYVYRNGSAADVDEEVKYLAELDLDRQQQRYSLARILIWATPMLGFLGTVLGISQALGGISVGPDNDFESMMNGLRGSLYVAFDTTALALTLSMVLMFVQFLVDRFESQLLSLVDQRSRSEIFHQFESAAGSATDEKSVERLGQHLLLATREMMVAQTDIWKRTIQSAEQAWSSSLTETSERVRSNWSESVESTLTQLAQGIDRSVVRADESMSRRWKQWQVMLSDNARLMSQQQQELAAQTNALQALVGKSENEHAVQDALQGALKAMETTEKLTTAIGSLSDRVEKLNVVGNVEPDKPVSNVSPDGAQSESGVMKELARSTFRKEVNVTRRQVAKRDERSKPVVGSDDVAAIKNGTKSAAAEKGESTNQLDEVVFSIAPYLSGQKMDPRRIKRRKPVLTRSNSRRKTA